MKGIVHSSEVSDLVPISFASFYDTSEKEHTYGFISKNSLWMCLVHDTSINIFSTETGRFCGNYNFGDSLKNPSARITNVCELSSSHIPFQSVLVSVKQDHESLLCMFNVDANEVVQAILVPERISSLEVVSGNGGVCKETHYLNRRLRYMFGIVAIGTVNGHVYFLDLCLDESFSCDETEPNITIVLKQHEYSAQRREIAISKKQHIFMHLNDESDRTGKFEFHSRSSILGRYPNSEICVSAIKYFRSLTTLAVGFSFGGIQLWELHNLTLQFTVSTEPHTQPIVNFAFQEPENDPRNFCYLWIFRGHSAVEKNPPSAVSCATMYSMTFYKREYVKGFGALYIELQTCTKRFEFPFTNDIYHSTLINPNMHSRLLSCQVVSQKDLTHSVEAVSGNESCEVSEDMSLCFISWEVWYSENVPSSYHFAVFDLNQWYQAQMPCSFRCDPSSLSPYFGIFSLNETRQTLGRKQLLGLCVIPQSIRKFKSLSVSEEFFYPSSLGFQIICFSLYGLCKTTYFGFQKHLLFEMAELGPKVLINPKEVFSSLIKCGLVTDTHNNGERTPLIHQKEAILQLALEYHLPFFFTKCMKEWRYSDSVHEYCTSRALLNWAWKKVIAIKSTIDRLSLTLFNCSGIDVDKASLKSLYAFRRQLNLIDNIMAAYQKYVTPRTEQGIQDLQCRRDAVSCVNLYLQVLLWLRSVHVLPEVCESEASLENVVFHSEEINKSYLRRRTILQNLSSSIGPTDVLLIDGIINEANVSASWQEKGGSGIYPPPSIYAALGGYLLDGVNTEWKHAVTYYLLLDLRESSKNSTFKSEVKKFPVIFGMTKSMIKLVKAYWYLDRKDCDNAIKKLLDPSVKSADILPWQHQRIIKSFLYYRSPQKALKYINHMLPPQNTLEDMRLYMSVLLASGATTQAFEYQKKKQLQGYGNDLLKHLFLGCQEMGKMRELMYLPLNCFESAALTEFLSESEDARAQEALVIYHLLHCNFFEAEKVNDKLALSLMKQIADNSDELINERTMDRGTLVECLMSGLSKTEKHLVDEIHRLPPEIPMKEESLKPLSISVKSSAVKKISYSDFLMSLMLKAPLTVSNLQTPLKSRSFYGELPLLRSICTPDRMKQPIVKKNNNFSVNKRSLLSTSPSEFSSPAKRSRLLDNATFKETPMFKRKTPKHLAGDIASLLQTPPIHRRVSLVRNNDLKETPTTKPHSILKKSQSTVNPPPLNFSEAETPPLLSEDQSSEEESMQIDEKNLEDTDSEGQSKQIRFDIPVAELSMSEHVATHSESNIANESLASANDSTIDETKHSGKISRPSLTREPLEGFLKQASQSIISIISNESEINACSRQESRLQSNGSDSDPIMANYEFSSSEQNEASASQRYQVLPRPPLRNDQVNVSCEKPKHRLDETNVTERSVEMSITQTSHEDYSKSFLQQPSATVDENTVIVEDSDEEMFYSPSSPNSYAFGNISERLGEPIPFSDDSILCGDKLSEAVGRNETISMEISKQNKDSVPSKKAFVFTRSSQAASSTETNSKTSAINKITFQETESQSHNNQVNLQSVKASDIIKEKDSVPQKFETMHEKKTALLNKTYFFTKHSTVTTNSEAKTTHSIINDGNNLTGSQTMKSQGVEVSKTFILPSKGTDYVPEKINISSDIAKSAQSVTEQNSIKTLKEQLPLVTEVSTEESSDKTSSKKYVFTRTVTSFNTTKTDTPVSTHEPSGLKENFTNTESDSSRPNDHIATSQNSLVTSNASSKSSFTSYVFTRTAISSCINKTASSASLQKVAKKSDVPSEIASKALNSESLGKTFTLKKPVSSDSLESSNEKEKCKNSTTNSNQIINSRTSQETGKNFVFSKPFSLADESNLNEILNTDLNMESSQQEKLSNKTFLFSKPRSLINDNANSNTSSLLGKEDIKEKVPETKPSRKTYVFTKSSSTTSSTLNTSTKPTQTSNKSVVKSPFSLSSKKKSRSSTKKFTKPIRKTYVFTRSASGQKSTSSSSQNESTSNLNDGKSGEIKTDSKNNKEEDMDIVPPKMEHHENVEFLQDTQAETYEQFTSSLAKNVGESNGKEEIKPFLSSPCTSPVDKSKLLPENNSVESTVKDPSLDGSYVQTSKNPTKSKKKKSKAKTKKMEFSFAEPHSPPPDILEALSQTEDPPLPTFLFSPPLTRGRLRKKINESLGSSFSSVVSEASFSTSMRPPMDPILEGIILEKSLQTKKVINETKAKLSTKKKSVRKSKVQESLMDISDQSLLFVNESKSYLNSSKQTPSSPRHSMVLRQTRSKRDTSLI